MAVEKGLESIKCLFNDLRCFANSQLDIKFVNENRYLKQTKTCGIVSEVLLGK